MAAAAWLKSRPTAATCLERKGIRPLKAPLSCPVLKATVRCRVAAAAFRCADAELISQTRRQPIAVGTEKLPLSFLKHAEDQTVVALLTVLDALDAQDWHAKSFADWGVIAAPSRFGRHGMAASILGYCKEGPWGVSPHVIPQQSFHAMSGAISQALKIHGPNFGVSGGPNPGPDGILLAAAMLADGNLPGLWLLVTGHESEWIPSADGQPSPPPVCNALALALTPTDTEAVGLQLEVGQLERPLDCDSAIGHLPEFHLGLFADEWSRSAGMPTGRWRVGDAHWLDIEARGEE